MTCCNLVLIICALRWAVAGAEANPGLQMQEQDQNASAGEQSTPHGNLRPSSNADDGASVPGITLCATWSTERGEQPSVPGACTFGHTSVEHYPSRCPTAGSGERFFYECQCVSAEEAEAGNEATQQLLLMTGAAMIGFACCACPCIYFCYLKSCEIECLKKDTDDCTQCINENINWFAFAGCCLSCLFLVGGPILILLSITMDTSDYWDGCRQSDPQLLNLTDAQRLNLNFTGDA